MSVAKCLLESFLQLSSSLLYCGFIFLHLTLNAILSNHVVYFLSFQCERENPTKQKPEYEIELFIFE